MTATKPLGTYGNAVGTVTPADHKAAQSGLIAKTSLNAVRAGLFWGGTANIITAKPNMSYDVAPFTAALSRGATFGTVLMSNDGTLNIATTAAPGSNSRIDIIYVWAREYSLDGVDSNPVIGVIQGTAAASPTAPSLAAFPGAIELGRATVAAGITATTSATLTQTAPFTCVDGGRIPFRNTTERGLGTYVEGQLGWLIDTNTLQVFNGSTWDDAASVGVVTSGTFTTVSSLAIDGLTGYRKYRVTINIPTASTGNELTTGRLRSGGAPDSTASSYDLIERFIASNGSTSTADGSLGNTSWPSPLGAGRPDKIYHFEIDGLNDATRTMVTGDAAGSDSTTPGSIKTLFTLRHRVASAFNGIEFAVNTGTITGTYIVEGVR